MAYHYGKQTGVPGDDDGTNHRVSSHGGHQARRFYAIDDDPVAGCAVPHASALLYFKKPTSRSAALNDSGEYAVASSSSFSSSSFPSSSYADGFYENPMTGSPVTGFVTYKDTFAAAAGPGPLRVLHSAGEDHSLLSQSSRPMSRGDTHKIVVGTDIFPDHIISHIPSTTSAGTPSKQTFKSNPAPGGGWDREASHGTTPSFEDFLAQAPFPQSTGASQQGKSYIPTFLRAGVKVKNGHATEFQGLPNPVTNQGKAAIPACLTPGWGESPRNPPMVGKSGATIGRAVVGKHHHDEMHLGGSTAKANLPDEPVPKKSKGLSGVRRALERPWKKRNVQNEAPTESTSGGGAKARVLLAQSGPASMVAEGVFSPEVVVTSPFETPSQAKVSVSDLPCTLRPGHASHAISEEKDGYSPNYKWPLVDLTDELFLNFDPKKDQGHGGRTRGLKHQEPRIVGEDFFGCDLHDEVLRDLASRERRDRTSNSRPISQAVLEVDLDATSSVAPYSALAVAKEMAIIGGVTRLTAKEVQVRPQTKASSSQPVTQSASDAILTVPTPEQDEVTEKTDQADFSWFRFSRVDLEDPADEHCRNYRNRRREMRRSKQESWFESGTQEDEVDGSNGTLPVRDPKQSWLVL